MRIDHQQVGTVDVIMPLGTLVEDEAAEFAEQLQTRLAGANMRMVLDMHEVPYLDSTALEALADAADHMEQRSTRLRMVGATATVREVLELTGLSRQIQFFEQVDDAVRSFL